MAEARVYHNNILIIIAGNFGGCHLTTKFKIRQNIMCTCKNLMSVC